MTGVESSEFYAVAAQVIPLMFISLAFESRSKTFLPPEIQEGLNEQGARRVELLGAWYTIFVTLVLAIGEMAALLGLRIRGPLNFSPLHTAWFVLAGLVIGGVGIIIPLMVRQVWAISGVHQELTLFRLVLAVVVTGVLVYVVASFAEALIH